MSRPEEIRERVEKVSEGPWEFCYYEWTDGGVVLASKGISSPADSVAFHASNYPKGTKRGARECEDMEFIAHARSDVPWLLERVSELETENERLKKDNRRLTSLYYRPQAQEVMSELVALEAENERLRGHFEVEGEGLRCNVCGRWDGFNEL